MDKVYKRKKVYKVVQEHCGNLVSTYAPPKFEKRYVVGEKVLPAEGTKLFCFFKLKDAVHYARCTQNCYVYEARATNAHLNGWLSFQVEDIQVLKHIFAEDGMDRNEAYASVAVCDSLTLVRRIQ